MLERLGLAVAAIVSIHEGVRAGLQFVVDAAGRFDLVGAGAGPRDDRTRDPRCDDQIPGAARLFHCCGDGGAPLVWRAQVLRAALIGQQAHETQTGQSGKYLRQRQRIRARRNTAAVCTGVDFNIDIERTASVDRGSGGRARVAGIVYTQANPRTQG